MESVIIKLRLKVTDYAYTHTLMLNKGTVQEQLPVNQRVKIINKEYIVTKHNHRGTVEMHQVLKNSISKTKRVLVSKQMIEYK